MKRYAEFTVFAVVVQMAMALPPTEVFVTTDGTGLGYPTWADATNCIQGAINIVSSSPAGTVWVSNGVYAVGGANNYPSGTLLTNRVAITKPITVRSANNDPANTIIMGAWDPGDPVFGLGPAAVRCVYMVDGASLIGFTITNGATLDVANTSQDGRGAGVWSESVNTVISNCVIVGNSAKGSGGGTYRGTLHDCLLAGNSAGFQYWSHGGGGAMGSTLYGCVLSNNYARIGIGAFDCTLFDCTIVDNTRGGSGAVCKSTLYNCTLIGNNVGALFQSILYDCLLQDNFGNYGAGAYMQCELYRCTLIGNTASQGGGGVDDRCVLYDCLLLTNSAQYGGAASTSCRLYNCTLIGNSNTSGTHNRGGGVDNKCVLYNSLLIRNTTTGRGGGASNSDLHNCTVVSNTAAIEGGGVWGSNVVNSIVYFNTAPLGSNHFNVATALHSCTTPEPETGSGNITDNPRFVDLAGGNYRLQSKSPCIDKGMNADWMTTALDLDGAVRIQNGIVDIGAYETTPNPIRGACLIIR